MTEGTTYHFGVDTGSAGTRLDLLLPRLLPDLSRSRGQQLIGAGLVTVNGGQESKHYAVRGGDRLVAARKKVVGFDVVELTPIPGLIPPDFLAAKLIYRSLGEIFFPFFHRGKKTNAVKET